MPTAWSANGSASSQSAAATHTPAALAFAGDTYQGLEAGSLDPDEMAWAQEHLRILSGLYGVLRPLDAIEPYRLELGSRLATARGRTLYDYWGDRIARALRAQAESVGTDTLINCASQEYFGAVDMAALGLRVITPVFMEEKAGTPKVVSFYAKKARGAMARFVIQHRLTDPAALKEAAAVAFKQGVACALFSKDPVKGKAMCYVSVPEGVSLEPPAPKA